MVSILLVSCNKFQNNSKKTQDKLETTETVVTKFASKKQQQLIDDFF